MGETFGEGSDVAWDDICASCLMRQRGVSLERLAGLWAFQLNASALQKAIHSADTLPLTFHYIKPEDMYFVRDELAKPISASFLQVGSQVPAISYFDQLEMYLLEQ